MFGVPKYPVATTTARARVTRRSPPCGSVATRETGLVTPHVDHALVLPHVQREVRRCRTIVRHRLTARRFVAGDWERQASDGDLLRRGEERDERRVLADGRDQASLLEYDGGNPLPASARWRRPVRTAPRQ